MPLLARSHLYTRPAWFTVSTSVACSRSVELSPSMSSTSSALCVRENGNSDRFTPNG